MHGYALRAGFALEACGPEFEVLADCNFAVHGPRTKPITVYGSVRGPESDSHSQWGEGADSFEHRGQEKLDRCSKNSAATLQVPAESWSHQVISYTIQCNQASSHSFIQHSRQDISSIEEAGEMFGGLALRCVSDMEVQTIMRTVMHSPSRR